MPLRREKQFDRVIKRLEIRKRYGKAIRELEENRHRFTKAQLREKYNELYDRRDAEIEALYDKETDKG